MPTFRPKPNDYRITDVKGTKRKLLSASVCDQFNASLLGLGDLTQPASQIDAIAAVFDLEGFTNFSKQIEPHLSVPLFLSEFLPWLMLQLRKEMINEKHSEGIQLYCSLPFFVKFMGDGLLVLWDSSTMRPVARRNVLVSVSEICETYVDSFLPMIRQKVAEPPSRLRCGVARGNVYSVGDGNDFVGSCINMAARLQKLPGVTFAFNRRGFDLEDAKVDGFFKTSTLVRKVVIRGIGENELVAIMQHEFGAMSAVDKAFYREP